MKKLFEKLNYKNQERIVIINAEEKLMNSFIVELPGIIIDREIDPRFPYSFILIFVKSISEVDFFTPVALHNLMADGILWFCYPKKTSKKYKSDIDRDHGWKALNDLGFNGIRLIAIDEDWSALRFRNIRFIKSANERFSK